MRVALVLVSHVAALGEACRQLASQMAPSVTIAIGSGLDEGAIGTSYDVVHAAIESVIDTHDGVVVLTDLGSAVLTAQSVLEFENDWADVVRLVDAPFVEGAVAAAVAAQQGGTLADVATAAEDAGRMFTPTATDDSGPSTADVDTASSGTLHDDGTYAATVTVRNKLGLHARPAALVARTAADTGVPLTVDGVDATSVLMLLSLAATGGRELRVEGTGPGARDAVTALVALIDTGFGEE